MVVQACRLDIRFMKYDLAKELADGVVPQDGKGSWAYPPDKIVSRRSDRGYVPTLSELIEACEGRDNEFLLGGKDDK